MSGYWRNREETERAFLPGGWLRTGDIGRMDDGYLYLLDRSKDMIVTGAENVYPAEVENLLMCHPQVAEAAVIGIPDERWGEAVHAFVVTRAGSDEPTPSDLIDFCREKIAGYKCPKSVEFVASLPRNATGKVLKRQLREPFWMGDDRRVR